VGILRPWHGVEKLVSAMERLVRLEPAAHLLLVGDGPVEDELKATVDRLGIRDHVTFTGRVGRDAVRDYILCMDIAASPKATFYASPMKILEYMAMGLPTVAPDMANIRDIITDGQEGLLFAPDDEESMFDRIHQLLKDGTARRRMGANARTRIEQELNWRNNALGVLEIAEKLLA
jgi:glycosyltransferase involved in cell wall biosynthesis